jgi:hypothetical protein
MTVSRIALAAALGVGILLGVACSPRETQPCTACTGTGAAACGAAGCVNGRIPCPSPCLKREDPNWQVTNNPHFGPNTLTLKFTNDDGSYGEVSQSHVGQVMVQQNGQWNLGPPCTQCGGSTRILCPSCKGKKDCPVCRGKGEIPK